MEVRRAILVKTKVKPIDKTKATEAIDKAIVKGMEEAPKSIFANYVAQDYTPYKTTIQINNWIMGGIPQRIDIIEGWLKKGLGIDAEEELRERAKRTAIELFPGLVTATMTYAQVEEIVNELAESHVNTFKRGPTGVLYIEGRQVKAALKEAINVRYPKERVGHGKGAKKFAEERVFVEEEVIPLGVSKPDGRHLFVGHVTDQRGERSTLTHYDYVVRPTLHFVVQVQSTAVEVMKDMWPYIWGTAEHIGLGALRSQGFGTFVVTEWKKLR